MNKPMKTENKKTSLLPLPSLKMPCNLLIISVLKQKNMVTNGNKTFINSCKSMTYKAPMVTKLVTMW